MKQNRVVVAIALSLAALSFSIAGQAQNPTAVQRLQLSAFGGVTPVSTGLDSGNNGSLTAGVDLALPPFRFLRPTVEVRGTYPFHDGQVASEKSVLAGLRVDVLLGRRFHPYVDFLFGRGEMDYAGNGYIYDNFVYDVTTTNVYSPGFGLDYDLTEHFALKLDGQLQQWSSEPTASGTVESKVGTIGVVYRFNFNRGPIR